jgi:hypothetical protein
MFFLHSEARPQAHRSGLFNIILRLRIARAGPRVRRDYHAGYAPAGGRLYIAPPLVVLGSVTRYSCAGLQGELEVPAPAERMRMMRERRRRKGLREIRLDVPDPRLRSVRKRVAAQVARLDQRGEDDAVDWIEQVSEFDAADPN